MRRSDPRRQRPRPRYAQLVEIAPPPAYEARELRPIPEPPETETENPGPPRPQLGWRHGVLAALLAIASNVLIVVAGWWWTMGLGPINESCFTDSRIHDARAEYQCRAFGAFAKQVYEIRVVVLGGAAEGWMRRGVVGDDRLPLWVQRGVSVEYKRTRQREQDAKMVWVCGNGWPLVCVQGVYSERSGRLRERGILASPVRDDRLAGAQRSHPEQMFRLTWRPEPRGFVLNMWLHWVAWIVVIYGLLWARGSGKASGSDEWADQQASNPAP